VHLGHLRIAAETRRLLGLSRTLLLPTAVPPHKRADELSPVHHRVAMLQLAVSGSAEIEICRLELEPERVCYTIDTLRTLKNGRPARRPIFILGMDSLLQITIWRNWQDLVREFDLAVIERSESEARADESLDPTLVGRLVSLDAGSSAANLVGELQPGRGGRIFRLPIGPIPISSSAIRARSRSGLDLGNLVPPAVAGYIQRTGLYLREDTH
jgi:nicotinate-nucleotide adenylyltransferase